MPVMLLDQAIPGSFLPAVVTDYAEGGDRIGRDLRARGAETGSRAAQYSKQQQYPGHASGSGAAC
ncbi:MAG: hypothetical protein L6W00_16110 [Lentisphaeria bacterium]|nr:MAG: hypothetical protein L6W00_16110 [Lentisphaeria bacterium]